MALTFPREMLCGPGLAVQSIDFALGRYVAKNQLYGGATQVRELAEPRWRGTFTYAATKREHHQALQAWLDSLRGGLRTFLGYDALKPYPLNYRNGFPAGFGGYAAIASQPSVYSVGVSPVFSGFVIAAGDMIELRNGTARSLHRVVETITAGGTSFVLPVEPRYNTTLFPIGSVVNFYRPACLMVLDPDSISASQSIGFSPVSFSGVQVLV